MYEWQNGSCLLQDSIHAGRCVLPVLKPSCTVSPLSSSMPSRYPDCQHNLDVSFLIDALSFIKCICAGCRRGGWDEIRTFQYCCRRDNHSLESSSCSAASVSSCSPHTSSSETAPLGCATPAHIAELPSTECVCDANLKTSNES